MADSRFYKTAEGISLSEVAALTGAVITAKDSAKSNGGRIFTNVAPLDRATASDISFLDNVKYIETFGRSAAGACFVRSRYSDRAPAGMVLLVTDEPYYAYALTARHFHPDPEIAAGVSPQAQVSKSATVGRHVRIDAGAVIGDHVIIGDHCWIGANTVIGDGVEIGSHCRIGALCSISHAIIGQRVILHRGIHIGQDGFGFAASRPDKNHRGGIVKVPQVGRVLIGDDVEIGSGTCIDRGAGPDTVIGNGSKIDNLVQIGHNVQIGKFVIIAAQCGIAGSTSIGDGAMLGGQVGLSGHIRIGAGAKLAAQSGVMTDIPPGATYGGSPAVPVKEWHRQTVAVSKLVKKKELSDE